MKTIDSPDGNQLKGTTFRHVLLQLLYLHTQGERVGAKIRGHNLK